MVRTFLGGIEAGSSPAAPPRSHRAVRRHHARNGQLSLGRSLASWRSFRGFHAAIGSGL